jgi:5-methylcytosine-specific restriction endonuclease McrA
MAENHSTIFQICRKCKVQKDVSFFNKDKSKKLGVRRICKECHRKETSEYALDNKDVYSKRAKEWYLANKAKKQEYDKKYRKKYYDDNKAYMLAKTNVRRSSIRAHTPSWSDKKAIKEIYLKAAQMSIETGIQHEVDHIVPIMSKIVCGLHCQQNLQIITSYENKKKSNIWWPDMP